MATITYSWVNKVPAFLVNTAVTAGTQTDPVAVDEGNGNYYALWSSPVAGQGIDVEVGALTTGGTVLVNLTVNPTTTGDQSDPAAAGDLDEVYTDNSSGTNRIFITNGNGTATRVDAGPIPDSDPAIAKFNGNYLVTWTRDNGASDLDVLGKVVNATGGSVITTFVVDGDGTLASSHSSAAALSGGGFVVAWQQTTTAGASPAVMFQLYNNSGVAAGADGSHVYGVHVEVGSTGAIGGVLADTQVKALADGGFVVAWTAKSTAGNFNVVDVAIYNADGSVRATGLTADPVIGFNHDKPSIAVLSNGDFVVSWTEEASSSTGYQAFDPNGNKLGSAASIDSTVVRDSITSLSGASNDGGLIASVFESTVSEAGGSGDSIRSSVNELVRTSIGTSGNDTINGDSLRDIINGKGGEDSLLGGANADTFVFDTAPQAFPAEIFDYDQGNNGFLGTYSASEGDTIDVSALVSTAYNHGSGQVVNALVRAAVLDAGPVPVKLQVDLDGAANGANWVTLATLDQLAVGNTVSVVLDASLPPVTITVDTPPVVTGGTTAAFSTAENSTTVTTVHATDANAGQTLTYAIAGGSDAALFNINSSTGALSFKTTPDYENPADSDHNNSYIVQVTANDGNQTSDPQTVTVNVKNIGGINDFGGDDHGDVLFHNDNGAVSTWNMNDHTFIGTNFASVPTSWHIAGKGDFNGDGFGDIIWRNDNGAVSTWDMHYTTFTGNNFAPVPTSYSIVGTGDFNGDGKTDILWRDTGGNVSTWDMNDATFTGHNFGAVPLNYTVVGTGDFNGDGKTDILWRDTSGNVSAWFMNDTTFTGVNYGPVPTNYTVVGTGDFNGDGKTDILWRDTAGNISTWDMNGTTYTGFNFGAVPLSWHVADTGDYNGDGKADIVFRNDNGAVSTWDMNDHTFTGFDFTASSGAVPTSWHIS